MLFRSDLILLGQKIYREKYALKKLMGFEPEKMVIPARLLETKAFQQQLSPEKMDGLLQLMAGKLSVL